MSSRPLIILIVTVLVILAGGLYLLIEIEKEEISTGWSLEARMNPLLAAGKFLEAMAVPVSTRDQLKATEALPAGGVVYLSHVGQVLTEGQRIQLHSWLEEGGHLVLSVGHDEEDNPLLSYYDVSLSHLDCGCGAEDEDEGDAELDPDLAPIIEEPIQEVTENEIDNKDEEINFEDRPLSEQLREMNRKIREEGDGELADLIDDFLQPEDEEEVDPNDLTRLHFEGVEDTLSVHLGTEMTLDHPDLYITEDAEPDSDLSSTSYADEDTYVSPYQVIYHAGTEAGIHFMQVAVGDGLLTVMAGNPLWENWLIDEQDHAYLLWMLSEDADETLLLYTLASVGLPELIWRNAPQLAVSFGLLLLALLWTRGKRFGPVRPATDNTRRSLREHLLSSAEYQWRNRQVQQLIMPLQRGIHDRAAHVLFAYPALDRRQKVEALSRHTGVSPGAIKGALSSNIPASAHDFTERVQILKSIREQL